MYLYSCLQTNISSISRHISETKDALTHIKLTYKRKRNEEEFNHRNTYVNIHNNKSFENTFALLLKKD